MRATSLAVLADFLLVHMCLIFTLVASWIRVTRGASSTVALAETRAAIDQYVFIFIPLSLIFPIAFYLSGVYRDHTDWALSRRVIVLLRGITIGLIVFLAVSFFLFPGNTFGVRTLLLFCVSLLGVLMSARLSRWAMLRPYDTFQSNTSREGDAPVLVIGGAGYIGSLLVSRLLKEGGRVRVLDSLIYGDGALRDVINHPNLELIVGDCRNLQTVSRAVSGVGSIVHLAAIVGDPACEQDKQTALEVNYAATRMLIEVAKGHDVKKFLFASSCSVYGASEEVMAEGDPVRPISLYATTKVNSEQALLDARNERFQPTILRLATVFGLSPRPRFDLVVNLLTAKAAQGEPITIFNGNQWRPFIHVSDVVDGFLAVLDAPLSLVGGEVFNLGDDRLNYTLTQVAELIATRFPVATIEHTPATDMRNYRVSFDKIHSRIGFECKRMLLDGIDEIREAFAQRRILNYRSYQYNNQQFLKLAGRPVNQDDVDESVMAAFAHSALNKQVALSSLHVS
jgi:nucleoside-diphosphate-sugar epimerase